MRKSGRNSRSNAVMAALIVVIFITSLIIRHVEICNRIYILVIIMS
uniref:Uncharacterized protein n=1 Tax=Meloidogyne enterolobii TaxID=390850 RepID=A0A6V7VEV5_MELEN|nr:unnamed protein product [Meloidogyne enterolobii]